MEIVKQAQARTAAPSSKTIIHEYDTQDGAISGATAEIGERYPPRGFALNQKIKELVYVISGEGVLLTPDGETKISTGDVVLLDQMEKFAWDGKMVLFMATTPRFDPSQYAMVD